MTGPQQGGNYADIGAQAMATTASLDEVNTLSTAQLMNGLSTLLVSEGLSRLVRDMLTPGAAATTGVQQGSPAQAVAGREWEKADRNGPGPEGPAPAEKEGPPGPAASRDDLVGMSSRALGELLTRSLISRIVDLNTANTHLALATSQQLHQWGKRMAAEVAVNAEAPALTPVAPPTSCGPQPPQPNAPPGPAFPFPPLHGHPAAVWGPTPYPGWTGPWAYPFAPGPPAPGSVAQWRAYPPRPVAYPGYYYPPSGPLR